MEMIDKLYKGQYNNIHLHEMWALLTTMVLFYYRITLAQLRHADARWRVDTASLVLAYRQLAVRNAPAMTMLYNGIVQARRLDVL